MNAVSEEYNRQGNAAFQQGQYQTALSCYTKAVATDGTVAKYHTNRANVLIRLDRHGEALSEAEAAITADSRWVKGWYFQAIALEQLGDLQSALAAVQSGLDIDSTNEALHDARIRLYCSGATASAEPEQQRQQRPQQLGAARRRQRAASSAQQQQQQQQHHHHHHHQQRESQHHQQQVPQQRSASGQQQQARQQQGLSPSSHSRNSYPSVADQFEGMTMSGMSMHQVHAKLRHTLMNAGSLFGPDGRPHPFGWTKDLDLEQRADWLIDCYRLRAYDDQDVTGGVRRLHGVYAPDYTAESLCEDFLVFCLLAYQHKVAPAGWQEWSYDAWPGWGYLLPLAAERLVEMFTQKVAESKWGVVDAGPDITDFSNLLDPGPHKRPTASLFYGKRNLRYTATVVYGFQSGEQLTAEVRALSRKVDGRWKEILAAERSMFTLPGLQDECYMLQEGSCFGHLGGAQLWEEMCKKVGRLMRIAKV